MDFIQAVSLLKNFSRRKDPAGSVFYALSIFCFKQLKSFTKLVQLINCQTNMNRVKVFTTLLISSAIASNVWAQKLPDEQEEAKWASTPVKIDGKTEETKFMAYNKATRLSYTLSNDAKNLYLVMQSADANKVLLGGITVTINTSGKKKEKDAPAITFPVIVRQNRGQGGQRSGGGMGGGGMRVGQQGQGAVQDSAAILERRKQQVAQFKEIRVIGIDAITDTLISIYNEHGIKAALSFDIKGTYTYEMAIPLSLLKIDMAKPHEFAYNIRVNGRSFGGVNFGGGGFGGGNFGGGGNRNFDPSMFEPTFFWGKYLPANQ